MNATTLTLLTVIADESLLTVLEELMMEKGARGYTVTYVQGKGRSGSRESVWDGVNVKVEAIVPEDVTKSILTYLATNVFDHYAIIAYYTEVNVIRREHFAG